MKGIKGLSAGRTGVFFEGDWKVNQSPFFLSSVIASRARTFRYLEPKSLKPTVTARRSNPVFPFYPLSPLWERAGVRGGIFNVFT